jgi:hypothetical protein
MEKQTNVGLSVEPNTQLDVSKLSNAQLQSGIDRNMHDMVQDFVNQLKVLEQVVGRQVDVAVNAKLSDSTGRKIHIRVRK